jgi:hypothetical protein
VVGKLLWQADFTPGPQWLFEAQGGTLQFVNGAALIDCCQKRGATLWVRREFPADLVIEYAGACLPPSTGRNLNCFFCARSPDGRPLDAIPRTGAYQEYQQFGNYIFTLTCDHTRIRRDPGFEQMSELLLGSVQEHRYLIQIVKQGGRIQAAIDGRLIHDVADPAPHGPGWVALRTWNSRVVYDHWAVYELGG